MHAQSGKLLYAIEYQILEIEQDPGSVFKHQLLKKLGEKYAAARGRDIGMADRLRARQRYSPSRLRFAERAWAVRPHDRQRIFALLAALQTAKLSHPDVEMQPLRRWLYKLLADNAST